jgi:O-antigen ligase
LLLLSDDGVNPISRWDIWQVALQALLAYPLTGLGTQPFISFMAGLDFPRHLIATHAHNLWLQFGAAYGIPGLLAALWLTGGLLGLAWRWGRWRGLGLVVPVMIMQLFDYTLFYAGVLFPLILGLNALRDNADTPRTM